MTQILSAYDRRQRHLRVVRWLRVGLPVLALVIVALVGGQLAWRAISALTTKAPPAEAGVRMVNPSFTGDGKDGSRYSVTAASGVRDVTDAALIRLDQPVVTITQANGRGSRTVSQMGVFRESEMILTLTGDVKGERAGGDRFVADDVVIDTRTGAISGKSLKGAGPAGDVEAGSYDIFDRGDRVVMKGGVRARINPK